MNKELEVAEKMLKPVEASMLKMLDTLKGEEKFIFDLMADRLPECGEVIRNSGNCKTLKDYQEFFQALFEVQGIIEIFNVLKEGIDEN